MGTTTKRASVPDRQRSAGGVNARSRSTVVDKKLRQVHSALKRLNVENLVDLPNAAAAHNKYEGFLLNAENERRRRTNDLYCQWPN